MRALLMTLLLQSPAAFAALGVRAAGMFLETSNGSSSSSRTYFDVSPYYVGEKGGLLGGTYQSDSNSGYLEGRATSLGLSAGWMSRRDFGWYVIGTYFVTSSLDDGRKGRGVQGDLGYRVAFRHLYLAAQLTYKQFMYPAVTAPASAGTGNVTGASIAHVDPYFALGYEF